MSTLSQDEVDKQIKQMVAFIEQEAKEKAEEISLKAEEEFNIEKGRLVQQEKMALMQQYERKEKQAEAAKKIAYSTKLNTARLEVLKAQEDHLKVVNGRAEEQLAGISKDKGKYKKLVTGCIAQGLVALLEADVTLYCRKEDASMVKEVIPAAIKMYKDLSGLDCKCKLDTNEELPKSTGGGVILKAQNGTLSVDNTLSARLRLATDKLLPAVRFQLLGGSPTRTFFD